MEESRVIQLLWTLFHNKEAEQLTLRKKILVTGFSPFGGEPINPAWEAVKRLPDQIAGAALIKLEIPTSFSRCGPAVEAAVEAHQPDAVLCVGQAGGRACISVERVAINLAEAGIPDNDGDQPADKPIQPDGPDAYFSTLPVKAVVQNVRAQGIPCQLSYSAGTYVCNCVMYQALHLAAKRHPGLRAGFIHVPYLPAQAVDKPAGAPSMELSTLTEALEAAVEAIANDSAGVRENMGTVC